MRILIALFLGFSFEAMAACGPGDGGTPFVELSPILAESEQLVPTDGGVLDFVFWEKQNKIWYRNDDYVLHSLDLTSAFTAPYFPSRFSLSRISDPSGRYLAAGNGPFLFDTHCGGWQKYGAADAGLEPLFWNNNRLYSLRQQSYSAMQKHVEVYAYDPRSRKNQLVCSPMVISSEWSLSLAKGHSYPYIYFYQSAEFYPAQALGLMMLDLTDCQLKLINKYSYMIYGPIEEVYIFYPLQSFAVKVNHPTYNLLWHTGGIRPGDRTRGQCRYYNVGTAKSIVLNERMPVVATPSENGGIHLFNLNQQTSTTALANLPVSDIDETQLSMSSNGKTLYAAPEISNLPTRRLFKIQLPEKFRP